MTVIDKKIHTIITAAADFTSGDEIMSTKTKIRTQPFNRTITKVALVGSTNPADCGGTLKVAGDDKLELKNTSGGANLMPEMAKDWISVNVPVPNGSIIEFEVDDDAVGNNVVLQMEIGKYVKPKRKRFRRNYRRRRYYPRRRY